MKLIVKPYQFDNLLLVLWIIILVFFLLSFLFFALTLIKKVRRIRRDKIRKRCQEKINQILFRFIFESLDTKSAIEQFNKYFHNEGRLFAHLTIKSLIELHRIYKGFYQNKIEQFFVESRLSLYSIKLIKSRSWMHKVEGIRNLSELSYSHGFKEIKAHLSNNNKMVQEEAILGMIRLRGLDILLDIQDNNFYLSDWLQAHIIHIIYIKNLQKPSNLLAMLETENPSIHLLVARIAQHFQETKITEELNCIIARSTNLRIKSQISVIVENLKSMKI